MNSKNLVRIFKALGNERRFLILSHLFKAKELSVGQISELISLSFKSTSNHLLLLSSMDLVESRQVSLNKFYSINAKVFPKELIRFFKG
ncbi:MAG: metalloregulator ArsR/SmtB family transcription factor [bacterium]|nr:metalloregulator ArsR/SmtB family transcription factor [bacterium]